jgi:hypothetical protein
MPPPPQEDPALEKLLRQGAGYADHMLRTAGSVTPALFLEAPAGPVFCLLQSQDMSELSKDKMMEACRMLAISTKATAAVLVMESWLVRAKRRVLDTATRLSLNPDREEVVCLLGENPRGTRSRFLPILREKDGSYQMLGESNQPEADGAEGRFVGILPPNAPDIREFMQASLRVRQMGLRPDGIDPGWN